MVFVQALINELKPLDVFKQAEAQVGQQTFESLEAALGRLLMALQDVNQSKTFGSCRSCQYFRVEAHHYLCGLTEEPLNRDDTDKICRDHNSQANSFTDRE